MKKTPAKKPSVKAEVKDVVLTLKSLSSTKVRDGLARYGIPSDNALGISVGTIQNVAKEIGRNHELALALWETRIYEARLLCAFIDDPKAVTSAQMDKWCGDFDNWGIVDTICFKLFDQTPHAWRKVVQWSKKRDEFGKRAAFALLASLGAHDKDATDDKFLKCLPIIETAAGDDRNFVKKGVSWALRVIGRRNLELHEAVIEVAKRLASAKAPAPRWVGKDALRDITRPATVKKLKTRRK
jgi:3-methyladenine DNA glycosylase AlkD